MKSYALKKKLHIVNNPQAPANGSLSPVRNFSSVMSETTHEMHRSKQLFSNLIHLKTVSRTSELLGRTIARPNALLFGGILSCAVTIPIYLLSKNFGYSLSGFESIGAFLIGWTAGNLFDLLGPTFKSKK